jgi:hypothetical protein
MVKKKNIWKIISIVFIAIFALMLISALIRTYHFRPPVMNPSDSQISIVKNIAINDLKSKGEYDTEYDVRLSPSIRPIRVSEESRNIMEISFYNESVRHSYIINVDTASIQVYSKTLFYDGIDHSFDKDPEKQRIPILGRII